MKESRSSPRTACASSSRSRGRTSWPSTAPRPPAPPGSCPRSTSRRSATTGSRRRRWARGRSSSCRSHPGIELVLEAFPEYWRKAPQVKRIVMRSIPDESTRAAAVKTGEVDIAYLFGGRARRGAAPHARRQDRRAARSTASTGSTSSTSGTRSRRGTIAACAWPRASPSTATRSTRSRCSGFGKPTGSFVPPEFDFALKVEPPPLRSQARQAAPGRGGLSQRLRRGRPDAAAALHVAGRDGRRLSAGHRDPHARADDGARHVPRPRGARRSCTGLLIGATGAAGNAAARLEPFVTKGGIYAYGVAARGRRPVPAPGEGAGPQAARGAAPPDPEDRRRPRARCAPIFQQAFIWGVGSRVEEAGAGLIQGYPYAAPCEDLKLK